MVLDEMIAQMIYKDDPQGASKVQKRLDDVKTSSTNLAKSFKTAGIVFTAVFGSASALVGSFMKDMDELAKRSRDIGIDSDLFQKLGYSADLANISADEMNTGLKKLTGTIGKARDGGKASAEAFNKLGINLNNADGSAKSYEDILAEVSESLKDVTNESERAAIAQELFGKSGIRMGTMLAQGVAVLDEQGRELEAMGGVVSKETLAAVEETNDLITKVMRTIKGIGMQAIAAFLPKFKELLTYFQQFFQENAAIIRQNLSTFFDGLKVAIDFLIPVVFTVLKYWKWITAAFIAFQSIKIGMAIYAFGSALIAALPVLWGMVAASWAWAAALLANPLTWIILAVAGFITLLVALQLKFNIFGRAWDKFMGGIRAFKSWVKDVGSWIKSLWGNVTDLATKIGNSFSDMFDSVVGAFQAFWNHPVVKAVRDFFTNTITGTINFVKDGLAMVGIGSGSAPAPSSMVSAPMGYSSGSSSSSIVNNAVTNGAPTFNFSINNNNPMAMKNMLDRSLMLDWRTR